MILVPKEHYSLIKNKLEEAPTFVFSVLDSTIEGTVYANCADYKSLLIQTDSGLYYIAGQTIDELLIQNLVKFFETSVYQAKRFTLFSANPAWDQVIEKHLNTRVGKIQRYAFSFDAMKYESRRRSDNYEYEVAKIDSLDIQHCLAFDKKYYNEYWDSTHNFIQNGIGFCVKDRGNIISECVSIFKSTKYAEIDIVTDLNYRGKGLASIVAEQFIDYCLAETIQPRWDCDVDNSASINLGSKLGFANARKYSVYFKNSQNVQQ
ncbi:GNAT family N-acetyltransferase [Lysinibacillus sp. NPDC093210]|uniref:GNAT family N-acetyltransferase n=1 Tax=Lysinibacillus sp. NPDC093210 TaxID=3364133 RepID=UPI0037FCEF5A